MKHIKKSYYLNIIIVVLEIISLTWMMSGVKFFSTGSNLTAARLAMFKYFTVGSNFIMGLISLITLYEEKQVIEIKVNNTKKNEQEMQIFGDNFKDKEIFNCGNKFDESNQSHYHPVAVYLIR